MFVFERKALDVSSAGGFGAKVSSTSVRKAQDEVVERLKREASSLARLRHPSILQLVEPVEETRSGGLMFATEQVLAPLSAALSQNDRGSSSSYRYEASAKSLKGVEIDELEIQKGLLQIAKGLEFLHDSAKLVHGNLTPDAVFINAKSDWKISGLGFAGPPDNAEGHQTMPQISLSEALYNDTRVPPSVQLNLDYTSPDFVIDANINFSADIFSLGLVLIACYRDPHRSPIETHGNQTTYKKVMGSVSTAPGPQNNYGCSNKLPRELENTLPRILARRPADRMSASEFQESEYFDNILVNTMRFLDGLPAKTAAEKQQFMKGLGRVMPQFPVSALERKILSVLLDELKDRELLSVILQNVFQIVKLVPGRKEVLSTKVLPCLKEIFTTPAKSAERDTSKEAGLVVFLENIQIVSENSSAQQFKEDGLPIVAAAMQSSTHSLVDAALSTLSVILPVLDFTTVKHDLFPVIANVFAKTNSLGIKVRGLEALGVLCGATTGTTSTIDDDFSGGTGSREQAKPNVSSLDKFTMQEKVVPLLKGIKTKEPAVMMAALTVFQQIARAGDIGFLATEVMPILWAFALGPLLDLSQFKAYMNLIQYLTQKIQREQIRKLQELATVNKTDTREKPSISSSSMDLNASQSNGTGAEEDFEKLVLSSKSGQSRDVFAGALTDGQKLVQNPTSYSWQSTSGRTTPAPRLGVTQPQSRSITPDVSISGFPSLQPGSPASAWSQPLQPSGHASPATTPGWTTAQPTQPSSGTIWSQGVTMQQPAPAISNLWNQTLTPQPAQTSARLQATSYLNSSPASTSMTSNNNNVWSTGMGSMSAGSASNNTSFAPMLAPPPHSSSPATAWQSQKVPTPMVPQSNQPQQQSQQKQGLDKYQSLL